MKPQIEIRPKGEEISRFRRRNRTAAILAGLAFLLLAARFGYIQVYRYGYYHMLAENNRITSVPVPPNRGLILDRHGQPLAQNYSAYSLELTPGKIADLNTTIDALAQLVAITPADRRNFFKLLAESHKFETLPLRNRLTDTEVARIAANRYRLPGVEVKARLFRDYPQKTLAAHLLGYIGRMNDRDIQRLQAAGEEANYRGSDHIGKTGIEQSYEKILHGQTGSQLVETDASGHAVRTLALRQPMAGDDLVLSIDARMQAIAEQAFGDRRGALVAMDPRNGEILALVSHPEFDPNLFVNGIDSTDWQALNDSPDRPLLDRALRGAYPEGSTIKPFMALAGLHYGVRTPQDTIADPGYFQLPGSSHRYRDWAPNGHGMVDMHRSIVISCDTYYYRLANDLGIDRMHDYLAQFGFGRKTGIDLDGEMAGVLPSRQWKQRISRQPWYPGETVICGIGQGYNLTTPLQLAVALSALANGGTVWRPHVVEAVIDPRTRQRQYIRPQVAGRIDIPASDRQTVVDAMIDVTHPGGTAYQAFRGVSYPVAAKTGTAQVIGIRQNEKYNASHIEADHRDHAVFEAFAPADAPKIAVAVLIENGGHGGSTAAPIARAIMDYWLLGRLPTAPAAPASGGDRHAD